ncbi:excinuclease ABC subunit UvrC [Mycoplasmoides genitalium]|uniref:UvrABC system protein C n=2 Tax=Mycoplasmoides genitalium TaxID=2097 RepID=UVRC_MYCGE|nr:excinuclease ABC subunit UvrC [Mycoplasmoides genitalium]P47448.2 RecName: Full=UvrABC system protein C; Short=Protein UvrC; AltName: Full=Excinuclease ABC subunit C [Mycoplasmoides genitalium G37]AAC71424.1 excinuclease ABC, C subunit [Mycoplasmoides genitalium G37]ABY79366.1 excinuclease ABC, C subunit [synthetic Mycoplasma genitalium JCVI-1.0]AFQ04024.1 excinuclease ABC, C subunit [Mycoplasmoides genitalium M6320]
MTTNLKQKLKTAPKKPGCYLWKDSNGKVLYVGKASNIFNRVHQYFQKNNPYKTQLLSSQISDVDFFILKDENDALNLEAKLINQYQPRFNLVLKQNNGYLYFYITKAKKPTLELARKYQIKTTKCFGPFASSKFKLREIHDLLLKLFPLRKCAPHQKNHPCFYFQMGLCMGQCMQTDTKEKYQQVISNIEQFFNDPSVVINYLKAAEKKASDNQEFEKAQQFLTLQKAVLELTKTHHTTIIKQKSSHDFIGYVFQNNVLAITIFCYEKGELTDKEQAVFTLEQTDIVEVESAIITFIYHHYKTTPLPSKITVSLDETNLKLISDSLKIGVFKPKNGNEKLILQTVIDNAKHALATKWLKFTSNYDKTQLHKDLAQLLNTDYIHSLEIIDVSFYDQNHVVGCMLRFEDGKKIKHLSRRYNINSLKKGDTNHIALLVYRRILSAMQTKANLPFSDLLIIDGGKAQIKSVKQVFSLFSNVKPPIIIGLVKNKNHQTDHIMLSDFQVKKIAINSPLFHYLATIQTEVDGFAKRSAFNKLSNHQLQNPLLQIPGVGKITAQILFDNFQTLNNIKLASVNELSQFIKKPLAQKIKTYFAKQTD